MMAIFASLSRYQNRLKFDITYWLKCAHLISSVCYLLIEMYKAIDLDSP